jgi:hypothetical protein
MESEFVRWMVETGSISFVILFSIWKVWAIVNDIEKRLIIVETKLRRYIKD